MKILILTTCYPRRSTPAYGLFAHRQARALAGLGVDCCVLQPIDWAPPPPFDRLRRPWTLARRAARDTWTELDGIPVLHPVVYKPLPSRLFPDDYWTRVGHAVARFVGRRSQLRSADLLYAHFLCNEGYAGLIAARQLGMPLVAAALGDDVHAWPERWPDRRPKLASVLRHADGLVACSHALARDARRWAIDGLSAAVNVIYIGVDAQEFRPGDSTERRAARHAFGLPENRRLLLCVAMETPAKGWTDLLDAFAAVAGAAPEWDLVAAGPPSAGRFSIMVEATARGLGHRVRRLGSVPPARMPELYRAVDAFTLASHNEGLSNSVVEALASALPVVTTDVGGHAEIIQDGASGRLVPPRNVPALATALHSMMSNRDAAARLGEAGRRATLEHGDHRVQAARLLEYFERVVRAPRAGMPATA